MLKIFLTFITANAFGLDYYCDSKHYEKTISVEEMNRLVGVGQCRNCSEEFKKEMRDKLRDYYCLEEFWFLFEEEE